MLPEILRSLEGSQLVQNESATRNVIFSTDKTEITGSQVQTAVNASEAALSNEPEIQHQASEPRFRRNYAVIATRSKLSNKVNNAPVSSSVTETRRNFAQTQHHSQASMKSVNYNYGGYVSRKAEPKITNESFFNSRKAENDKQREHFAHKSYSTMTSAVKLHRKATNK